MYRRIALALFVVLMLVGLPGCVVRQVDSGEPRSESRSVSEFDSIDFSGFGRLEVELGDTYELELTGSASTLERVVTEVSGDTLRIGQRGNWSVWPFGARPQRLDVRVVVPRLERVAVSGAGDVVIEGLEGESFEFELSGAGALTARDVELDELVINLSGAGAATVDGVVDTQNVTLSGAGSYDGRDLETRTTRVEISGAGSAVVWAEERLDVIASGAGDVEYYGDPEVRSDISVASSVIGRGRR